MSYIDCLEWFVLSLNQQDCAWEFVFSFIRTHPVFLFILHIPFYTMVCATSCICGTLSLMWKTRDQRTDWFSFTISCKGSSWHIITLIIIFKNILFYSQYNTGDPAGTLNAHLLLNVLKINVDNEVFGFLKAFHICALHCQIWTQELLSFPLSFLFKS